MNAQLHFTISNQIIERTDDFYVVGESRNYLYAAFEFLTEEWQGLTKTVLFKHGSKGTPIAVVLDENDICLVPHEVLAGNKGYIYVSLFAGDLITVNTERIFIEPSGYESESETPEPPTPSVYEQLIALLDSKVSKEEGKGLSTNDFSDEEKAKLDSFEEDIDNKVDKVEGKGLSENDFTDAYKSQLDSLPSELNSKVDKVNGKGLSTNDYTNADKALLNSIQDKVDKVEGKGLSTNDFTDSLKSKLDSIEADAEKNVNADWSAVTGDAQILNKPTTLEGYGIQEVPASMIEGVIPIENLPASVIERMVIVADDTARFALTTATVQNGDTVKVESTGLMYYIVDDTKLNSESGYREYTAGSASSVPWSGVTNKPSTVSGYGITDTYTKTEEDNFLNSKVDKVTGKGLSENDYTTAEKNKLAGIENGAEKNVNPDWDAVSGDGQILHKPTTISGYGITDAYTDTEVDDLLDSKVDKVKNKGLSTNDYTNADKLVVGSITGALNQKVDKVSGKALSTNDFTNAYKGQLDGLNDMIAVEEESPATVAHEEGEYIIYNNVLYKCIDDIAIGDTLTVNTNIEATSITEALGDIQPELTFDTTPTENSTNPVTSDGIYNALQNVDNSEEMTLAQYNALTQAQKMDGTVRYITDVNNLPNFDNVGF